MNAPANAQEVQKKKVAAKKQWSRLRNTVTIANTLPSGEASKKSRFGPLADAITADVGIRDRVDAKHVELLAATQREGTAAWLRHLGEGDHIEFKLEEFTGPRKYKCVYA